MTLKQVVSKRNLIIVSVFLVLLVIANVFAIIGKTTNALPSPSEAVSYTIDYGRDIVITYNIKAASTTEKYYTDVVLNATEFLNFEDSTLSGISVELKTSASADASYWEQHVLSLGDNTIVSGAELGGEIRTMTLTITGYLNWLDADDQILSTPVDLTNYLRATVRPTVTIREVDDNDKVGYTRYEVPADGTYKIQLWGAQGNYFPITNKEYAGKGAYTEGEVYLTKGTVLYFYVGDNKYGNTGCNRNDDFANADTSLKGSSTWGDCYYSASFNGGGAAVGRDGGHAISSGGGASDVRYFGDHVPTADELKWDSNIGLNSRIMVAAGGGGTLQQSDVQYNFRNIGVGGAGGTLTGIATYGIFSDLNGTNAKTLPATSNTGGSQTSGGTGGGVCTVSQANGAFGLGGSGGNGFNTPDNLEACKEAIAQQKLQYGIEGPYYFENYLYTTGNIGGGGGGGYYGGGGGSALADCHSGGSGGSSYISGYTGAVAITSSTNRNPKCTASEATNNQSCSVHYSGLRFNNATMVDGNSQMPSKTGGTTVGNEGNGAYAITCIDCSITTTPVYTLTKKAKTGNGLETDTLVSGAKYALYSSNGSYINTYTTDANGQITLYEPNDVTAGNSYYLVETYSPAGYELNTQRINFTINNNGVKQEQTVYDTQKTGSVILKKLDNDGYIMPGVTFDLYKSNGTKVKSDLVSNANGEITVEGLDVGDYYFLETKTLDGYELSTEHHNFTISISSVETPVNITVKNLTKPGAVRLVKYNSDKTQKLAGAVYNLYKSDGTLLRENITTGSNGEVLIERIYWGSYYLKEVVAPNGYGVSSELVRFSINNLNCDIIQQIVAIDKEITKNVTVTKRIKISEIVWAHGDPTFIFKLTGTDMNNKLRTYYEEITFTRTDLENYLATHSGATYIEKSTKFSGIISGTYVLSEEDALRYEVESITSDGGTVNGNNVTFDLTGNLIDVSAIYQNKKVDQDSNLTHETEVTNVIKACTKTTYLTTVYNGTRVTPGDPLDRNNLTVTAYYDDGTSARLGNNDYSLQFDTVDMNANDSVTDTLTYKDPCGVDMINTFSIPLNPNPYHTVIVNQTAGGTITVTDTATGDGHTSNFTSREGNVLRVNANPADGYELVSITLNGNQVGDGSTFTMNASNPTYTATWKLSIVTVDVNLDDGFLWGTRINHVDFFGANYDIAAKTLSAYFAGNPALKSSVAYSGATYASARVTGNIHVYIDPGDVGSYSNPGEVCVSLIFIDTAITIFPDVSPFDYYKHNYPNTGSYPIQIVDSVYWPATGLNVINMSTSTQQACYVVTLDSPQGTYDFDITAPFPGTANYYVGVQVVPGTIAGNTGGGGAGSPFANATITSYSLTQR